MGTHVEEAPLQPYGSDPAHLSRISNLSCRSCKAGVQQDTQPYESVRDRGVYLIQMNIEIETVSKFPQQAQPPSILYHSRERERLAGKFRLVADSRVEKQKA